MKLKIKRKACELYAEQFNPPLQIPLGTFNVYETLHSGFVGEVKLTPSNTISQVLHSGDYIIYLNDGSMLAMPKSEFDNLFEVIEKVES